MNTDMATTSALTDEQILGIEAEGNAAASANGGGVIPRASGEDGRGISAKPDGQASATGGAEIPRRPDSVGTSRDDNTLQGPSTAVAGRDPSESLGAGAPPEWLKPLLADPQAGADAKQLWDAHAAYREAFATPCEARAVRELFPGGAEEARQTRAAAQELAAIDAAYLSADPRAQAQLAAHLAGAHPQAFASMLRAAARALAERDPAAFREFAALLGDGVIPRTSGEDGRGISAKPDGQAAGTGGAEIPRRPGVAGTPRDDTVDQIAQQRAQLAAEQSEFRAAQYAAFQQSANDAVVGEVRGEIERALNAALGADVSAGARKRIADDIFQQVHETLQSDASLARQVAQLVGQWQFDDAARSQVAQLIAGRAKVLLPGVARRVVADWTSSVLNLARQKAERQDAAARRVEITGGGPAPRGQRALTPHEIDYARVTDDQILNW